MDKKTMPNLDVDVLQIFNGLQSPCIVFAPDAPDFTIIAQNDAHENISFQKRETTVGKKVLDAFPDTSDEFAKTGVSELVESLKRVVETGKADTMPDLKYDLFDETGTKIEKFWSVTHYPIFKNGKIIAVYQDTKDITEERAIEAQLTKATTQLERVLATSLVGTWNWDIEHEIVTADRNLARMFGLDEEQSQTGLPLERFVESIHPEDRERVASLIEETVKQRGTSYEAEYRTCIPNTESSRWVLARGGVRVNEKNEPVEFSGTIIDITDRKRAEEELSDSERRLRFMADSMPQLVWVTRPDGYHEYYNQQWYDYTGTTPGTTDGEGWKDLFHPDDRSRAWKRWSESLKTGKPYEIEYRLYNKATDAYRWVIGRALPLKNDDGSIEKWYGTCTDIDEQKRLSDQQSFLADVSKELVSSLNIRKTLEKITQLSVPAISDWCSVDMYSEENGFEQVSVAHADPKKLTLAREYRKHNPLHIDDDTAIPRMMRNGKAEYYPVINNGMLEQYIEDAETLTFMKSLNLSSIMVVPLTQGKKTIGAFSFIAADSGRHFNESDFEMAKELAVRISLLITNAKLYSDSVEDLKRRRELEHQLRIEKQTLESRVKERTEQLQLTNQGLRDEITKRQHAEKELSTYSDELSRSNEELENFAYVASHDLQEPLRKIQAFGNLLLGEFGDSLGLEGADYLKRMHSAANRMSTLIEDLLAFSRVTRKEQERVDVDLNKTVKEVISDLEARITRTNAKVELCDLPIISADPTHMRQLFQNIIGNALKFHKPDVTPEVSVCCEEKNGGYEITVSDNGIGFDEKYLDRIFSVFQRLNERSAYEGTGIGLAVCKKIVERYDGTITAVSKKGKGSTFIIWLPKKGK